MNRATNLSITQHLAIGFGLLLLVVTAFAATVWHWQAESAAAERDYLERVAPRRERSGELERSLLHVAIALRAYVATPDDEHLSIFRERTDRAREMLRVFAATADADAAMTRAHQRATAYVDAASGAAGAVRAQVFTQELELELRGLREAALEVVRELTDREERRAAAAIQAMAASRDKTTNGTLVAAVMAALSSLLLAFLTARSIRKPTAELLGAAAALERGDWRPALAWAPGQLGAALNASRSEMVHIARAFGAAALALERREQRLRAEGEIAAATAASLDRVEVARRALCAAAKFVGAEVGVVYELDREAQRLEPIACHALEHAVSSMPLGDGVPGQAARDGHRVVLRDIPRDTQFRVRLGYDEAPPRVVAAVPIRFSSETLGVLLVASLRDLDEQALTFLERAASQLGTGLSNVRAYDESQRLLREVREKGEQIQAQNEELQAQNEEIQAQNEEIQAQSEQLQLQQEEIQAQNEELKQQSEELRAHANTLAEADERKNEFLGVLAHELRNPMAPIVNGLSVLKRTSADSEQAIRARAVIERQTQHLTKLIDDLLDVTRISRGKVRIERERLDLRELAAACVEDYRAAIEAGGLSLVLDLPHEPVMIDGDRTRVCQIIGNLLHNAVKFTERAGRITLALRKNEARQRAELRVEDNGIGIDPALLPHLFEPFSQGVTSLARPNGGLGLGLALVKSLVELHGGSVEARSDGENRGAQLVVELPLESGAVEAPTSGLMLAPSTSEGLRVLVIEDNRDAGESLRDAVELDGHRVELAASGAAGLGRARTFRPDVVLCDIGLPDMDGYEVARRFRADEQLRGAFLIALTGYASPADKQRAAEAGFDHHLAKPPKPERLAAMLAEAATLCRTQAETRQG